MSDLLNQASLVMVPSGYKEDTVYSVVPSDGSGDLSFTRASNGTRINSAGLVEDVPWNLLQQSETFDSVSWGKSAVGINTSIGTSGIQSNVADAPNGTLTADRVNFNLQSDLDSGLNQTYSSAIASQSFVSSIYVKGEGSNIGKQIKLRIKRSTGGTFVSVDTTITLTADWVQITSSALTLLANNTGVFYIISSNDATNALIWGAQLNIGSTAKPYFPTTDRLNVPRLTYQNGGGGCPSLLLEPQRTNLVPYSEQFDNASWAKTAGVVVTANAEISPDGYQNADLIQYSGASQEIYQNISSTTGGVASIYIKGTLNQTIKFGVLFDESIYTLTGEWQRLTKVFTVTTTRIIINTYSGATARNIYLWGAQLEAGAYPSSYIPTTSSSATRVVDVCSKTGISSLIGQTEGVLFADFNITNTGIDRCFINVQDSSYVANSIRIESNTSNQWRVRIQASSVAILLQTITSPFTIGRYKIALSYSTSTNGVAFYVNGALLYQGTVATIPSICDRVIVGSRLFGGAFDFILSDTVGQVALFPTRLTNAELASLTTI